MSAAGDHLQDTARRAALALPDVSHGYFFTPGLDVYKVAGKVFLIVTDDPDEQIITVKREPEHARAQVRGYASISPGLAGRPGRWRVAIQRMRSCAMRLMLVSVVTACSRREVSRRTIS